MRCWQSRLSRSSCLRTLIILGGLLAATGFVEAQTAPRFSVDRLQRIAVPEDAPKQWPLREQTWIPYDRQDYLQRLSRLITPAEPKQSMCWRRAHYTATLVGDTLTAGRFTAEYEAPDRSQRFFSLGNPSMAIEDLSWSGDAAVWGTDLEGRHWLMRGDSSKPVEGRWSARGRILETGVAFELELLSASMIDLEVQTPIGHVISSDVGDVELVASDSSTDWQTWRISLGDQSRCRLIVSTKTTTDVVIPTMLYDQELSVSIGQDEMQLEQSMFVELLGGDVSRFTVSLPRSVEIVSASSGEQASLAFERIPGEGPSSQVVVTIPRELPGRFRSFRLTGFLRRAPGEQFAVPQFVLDGGLWQKGRVNVTVSRPMELRSFRSPGYRQTDPASKLTNGESISFQQLLPRAQLLLNVDRPNAERVAHCINQLQTGAGGWTLKAEVAWESRSGTIFDAACRIPTGWQVVKVVRLGSGRELQETSDWKLDRQSETGQVLSVEFPEGLYPGRVDSVQIVAQRDIAAGHAPMLFPIVTPLDCEFSEVLLQVDREWYQQHQLSSREQFEPFDARAAATVWNTLPAWSSAIDQTADQVLLQVIHPETDLPLELESGNSRLGVSLFLQIELNDEKILERYELRLTDLAAQQNSLELQLPRGIRWIDADLPTIELPVERKAVPDLNANLPMEAATLKLPEHETGQLRLIGTRELPWSGDYVVPMVLFPQARSFSGRISLKPDTSEPRVLWTQEPAISVSNPPTGLPTKTKLLTPLEWSYQQADRVLRVRAKEYTNQQDVQWTCLLRTILSADESKWDYHELRLRPTEPIDLEGLRFQLSPETEFLAAWLDDRTLNVQLEGRQWTIMDQGVISDDSELVLAYRIEATPLLGRSRHQLHVPRISGTCARLLWQVATPEAMTFHRVPLGFNMIPALKTDHWWLRLCGPLGQTPAARRTSASSQQQFMVKEFASISSAADVADNSPRWKMTLPTYERTFYLSASGLPDETEFVIWNETELQIAAWVCFIGCLPVGWLLRRWKGTWRNQLVAMMLGLSASLALFGPDGWSELAGGLCSGLVLSMLSPGSRWNFAQPSTAPPDDRPASTEIFRRAAVPLLVGFMITGASRWIFAQAEAETAQAQSAIPSRRYQVLMPVDQQGKPSAKLPVVYVSEDLDSVLSAVSLEPVPEPTQLIAAAEYTIYQDQNQRPMLNLRYEIVCWHQASPVTLKVPLTPVWRTSLESCFVDGQPQSATIASDEDYLLVPVPSASRPGEAMTRHQVRLEIPLALAMNPQTSQFQGTVFPVLNSRLNWRSTEAISHVQLPTARGLVSISLDRRLLEAYLGATREVSLRQTSLESPILTEGQTEWALQELLFFRPMLTQVTFRAQCRVLIGSVDRLELELPPGGMLRNLEEKALLQTHVTPQPNGGLKVVLEFDAPRSRDFVIEGEYVLPRTSPDDVVDLPRLRIRCGQSVLVKHAIAIASPSEFTAQLINLNDPAVLPILVESFHTEWGDTFPKVRTPFAFQLQEGGQPSFRLLPVQNDQQVLNWHENIVLSPKGLDWELLAEMKTTAWPAHTFSVLLDRRLAVDRVSVTESGQNILERTSKTPKISSSQNRLTMFLNRETSGACQIRIHGTIRFQPTTPLMLPRVHFETPQTVPGTLSLYHEAGYRIQLEGKPIDLPDDGLPPGSLSDQSRWLHYGSFRLTEGDTGLRVRLEAESGSCSVQSVWVVVPTEPAWRLRGWMELVPDVGTREIRVVLPDWLKPEDLQAHTNSSPYQVETVDGQVILTVMCAADESAVQTLQWEAVLRPSKPTSVSWKLPVVPQATRQVDLAQTLQSELSVISEGTVVRVSDMPAHVRELLTQWQADRLETLMQVSQHTLSIRRIDAKSPDGRSSVALIHHVLGELTEGGWTGETNLYPAGGSGIIDVELPAGLEVNSLSADRLPIPLNGLRSDGRQWRIEDAGRYRRLTLRWKAPLSSSFWTLAGRNVLPLPSCQQEQRPMTFVAFVSQPQSWLVLPRRIEALTDADWAINLLEVEVQRCQSRFGNAEPDPVAARRLWHAYSAAAAQLTDSKSIAQMRPENRERWEAIVQFFNQLSEVNPSAAQEPTELGEDEFAVSWPTEFVGLLSKDSADLDYWFARRALAYGIAGTILVVASLWVLPIVSRWLLSPNWRHDRPITWFVLGVVWLLCWSPKMIAFALCAWGCWEWLRHRRSRPVLTVH